MSTRQAAQKLVKEIVESHGDVIDDDWRELEQVNQRLYQVFLQSNRTKNDMIGSSAITLAKNLYSSNSRFVFELLQNADDNDYSNLYDSQSAFNPNPVPYISFQMRPDRVIVECNEDGFNEENLRAICDIGKSSKVNSQRYIGEKGIGFKSVFKVAYKVIIQSGNFSFSFQHHRGDSGMGMINPRWEDSGEFLLPHLTRMTLLLHQDGNDPELRSSIQEQLEALNEEILLFTRKLKKIEVKVYDEAGQLLSSTTYSVAFSLFNNLVTTQRLVQRGNNNNNNTEQKTRHFHVTRHTTANLAKNENREYNQDELGSAAYSRSEIVLAFPLSENMIPVIKPQWVFAFMPVRRMGFKFVVHADFVTSANRQDIETTSIRNQGLANGIADAFVQGVLELCQHETLQYVWMRYLPSHEDSYPWDPFWSRVIDGIRLKMQSAPVLRPASLGPLCLIKDLKRHSGLDVDQFGTPLFADISPELYLSRKYKTTDLTKLSPIGLSIISMQEILDRVEADLSNERSRMRTESDQDWHSRAAKLLQFPFEKKWDHITPKVKSLDIIPLIDGSWRFAQFIGRGMLETSVLYPSVKGLEVPLGLGFHVVEPMACKNTERRKLFDFLGVREASLYEVCEAIVAVYSPAFQVGSQLLDPSTALSHAKFLYRASDYLKNPRKVYRIKLMTQNGGLCNPRSEDVYLPSDDPLGATKLLASNNTVPGLDVNILHDVYVHAAPEKPSRESLTWLDWLHSVLWVNRNLRLINNNGESLSDICKYVAKYRPNQFVSFLLKNWEEDESEEYESDAWKNELLSTKVTSQASLDIELRQGYFPTDRLWGIAARFLLDEACFFWFTLQPPFNQPCALPMWETISRDLDFGLTRTDLEFAMSLLRWLPKENELNTDPSLADRVYDLYCFLEAKIRESVDVTAARQKFRNSDPPYLVFIPGTPTPATGELWCSVSDCVWGRPPVKMTTKWDLEFYYAQRFRQFDQDYSHLSSFFRESLGVSMWNWADILNEIRLMSSRNSPEIDDIIALYTCLDQIHLNDTEQRALRTIFSQEALICSFVSGSPTWHTLSQCIWTTKTRIPGKTALNNNDDYASLESFFLVTLGVQKMTIEMLYNKLKDKQVRLSVDEVKQDLMEFSARLSNEGDKIDPEPIRQNAVFPVRLPDLKYDLVSASAPFVINDRSTLASDFVGKATFLDFTLDQARRIQPFIQWVGLGDRFLSKAVKEIFTADKATTRPISEPYREIKRKAHALVRISLAFGSSKAVDQEEAFYNLLRSCETLETSKITTELHISLAGRPSIKTERDHGIALQIDDGSDALRVFVPRSRKDREACFHSKLPRYFFEWMMDNPTVPVPVEGIRVVQAVLTASPFALVGILEEAGIPPVSIPYEEDESEEEETVYNEEAEIDVAIRSRGYIGLGTRQEGGSVPARLDSHASPANAVTSVADHGTRHPSEQHSIYDSGDDEDVPVTTSPQFPWGRSLFASAAHVSRSGSSAIQIRPTQERHSGATFGHPTITNGQSDAPRALAFGQPAASVFDEENYLGLLNQTIAAARQAQIPSRAFDMSDLRQGLAESLGEDEDFNTPFILRSASQLERDKRIGAAGELFVFELLSHLNPSLPNFERDNWRSNIRSYVTVHPEYFGMSSLNIRETADITYDDTFGALTSLLADAGYLDSWDAETLQRARPYFFIEVKSTTGPFETRFFMSKSQYRRMQNCSQSRQEGTPSFDRVYVIFRVYNLGNDSVGLKVLVDPEGMRQRGELEFTSESWSIVPAIPHD